MGKVSDGKLVQRVLAGETKAFRGLVERYQDAVFGVAISRTGSRADSEDISQETFLTAFDRLARLTKPDSFGSWLYRIALNQTRTHLRAKSRDSKVKEAPPPPPRPDELAAQREASATVTAALGRLSQANREAATLYYINGYTVADISRFTSRPAGTIKRRLHDARGKLRKELLTMVESQLKKSRPGRKFTDRTLRKITQVRIRRAERGDGQLLVADSQGWTYRQYLGAAEADILAPKLSGAGPDGPPDIHSALVRLLADLGYKIVSVSFSWDKSPNYLARVRLQRGKRTREVQVVYSGRNAMQFALSTGADIFFDKALAEMKRLKRKDGKPLSLRGALRAHSRLSPKPPFRDIQAVFRTLEKKPDSSTARSALGQVGVRCETPLLANTDCGVADIEKWMKAKRGTPMEGIAAGLIGALHVFRDGNLAKAKRYLAKAGRLRPDDKRIAFDMATVYALTGQADEAFALLLKFEFTTAGQYRNFLPLRKDARFKEINVSNGGDQVAVRIEQTDSCIIYGDQAPWEEAPKQPPPVPPAKPSQKARRELRRATGEEPLLAVRGVTNESLKDMSGCWILLELEDNRTAALRIHDWSYRYSDLFGALHPGDHGFQDNSAAAADVLAGLGVQLDGLVLRERTGDNTAGLLVAHEGKRRATTPIDGLAGLGLAIAAKTPILLTQAFADEFFVRGASGRPLSLKGAIKRLRERGME